MLKQFGITRLHVLTVSPSTVTPAAKFTFLSELTAMGYRVTNPEDFTDSILEDHSMVIDTLKALRSGDVDYVPLYQNFPEEIPELGDELFRRVCGMVYRVFGSLTEEGTAGSGGDLPAWLFDLRDYGADPVSQVQVHGLFERGKRRQEARNVDSHTEWIDITFVSQNELEEKAYTFLLNNLYAKSSIKQALWSDLYQLLQHFGGDAIDHQRVVIKESAARLMKYHWEKAEYTQCASYCRSATDVLRLLAVLTDSDVTLVQTISFPKLSRPQRREILGMLAQCPHMEEDLVAYRNLWKAVARGLHPCEESNRKRFPLVADVFSLLRQGKLSSYLAQVQNAITAQKLELVVSQLVERPGAVLGRLHQVLEMAGTDFPQVLSALEEVAHKIPLKKLLILQSYFSVIEEQEQRIVVIRTGAVRVLENRPHRLSPEALKETQRVLQKIIVKKVRLEKEPWHGKKVWIDPRLQFYTVPLQQRHMSDGLLSLGRGSTLPIEEGKILRLFMYWKDADTDLDLSVTRYDAEMNYRGDVSFQCTTAPGMVHSGDIQRAPHGAAEFIDIDLQYIRQHDPETRFLTAQVFQWTRGAFEAIDCRTGWMLRENVNPDFKSFDLKTVVNAVQLHGEQSFCVSLMVDLRERTITFIDLYVKGVSEGNNAKCSSRNVALITKEIAGMLQSRPNMHRLASYHLIGRGASHTEEADDADIRIGVDKGCDYHVNDVQTILTDFL